MLVFVAYRTNIARYVAKWGIAQMCLCKIMYQGGGIAPFWGSANLPEKVSRDMGYRSDSIAVSRDMGPLRHSGDFDGVGSVSLYLMRSLSAAGDAGLRTQACGRQ